MGTHFSRSHVAQLLSENSKLWDAVSISSELSALDLEQSEATRYVDKIIMADRYLDLIVTDKLYQLEGRYG